MIKRISVTEARDTGLAIVLILLLILFFRTHSLLGLAAIVTLVVTMAVPLIFKPLAYLWFGLSHVLGTVVSTLLLSLVFFVIVTPVGLIRRLLGHDSMKQRSWKKSSDSVLTDITKHYTPKSMEYPF